jgi:ankyrin repeat protein
MIVSRDGFLEGVQLLRNHNVDPKIKSNLKFTAYDLAKNNNHLKIAAYLQKDTFE